MEADRFYFFIDPYNDKRSGYYFALNAGGTYYDGILLNDDWDDDSWDGVWEGNVNIDEQGWTAEMRIPFSQLRFKKQDKYPLFDSVDRINKQNLLTYSITSTLTSKSKRENRKKEIGKRSKSDEPFMSIYKQFCRLKLVQSYFCEKSYKYFTKITTKKWYHIRHQLVIKKKEKLYHLS